MTLLRRTFAGCLLIGLGYTVWAYSAAVQPANPATIHPQRSVLYLAWDGAALHEEAIQETALYKALVESGLLDYGKRLLNQAMHPLLAQLGPAGAADDAEQIALLKTAFQSLYENGFSLSVTDGEGFDPAGILVLHNAAEFRPLVERLIAEMQIPGETGEKTISNRTVNFIESPNNPGVELTWWGEGNHLVVSVGRNPAERAIATAEGDAPNVTSNDLWKRCHSEDTDFEVAAVGWVDVAPLLDKFGSMPVPIPDTNVPVNVMGLARILGVQNLKAVGGQFGYRGEASVGHTFVDAPGERTGLLAMMDQPLFSLNELPPLPPNCTTFAAFSLDTAAVWDNALATLRRGLTVLPPEASDDFEEAYRVLPQLAGMDIRNDLLAAIGNIHCIYNDPAGGPFGLGAGFAASIRDREALERAIKIMEGRSTQIAQEAGAPFPVVVQRVKINGRELITLPAGVFTPTIGIGEEWVVFGLFPQSVNAFFMRQDGELPRWSPSELHERALAEMPKMFSAISVDDPRQGLSMLYSLVPVANSAIHTFLPGFGPEAVKAAELPPQEVVTAPLFPNVTMSVAGRNGVESWTRQSLPLMPVPTAESGLAAPVLVALLLPAVQQARMAARRTQSKNNMKQLGLAMHIYHDVYNRFPAGTQQNTELTPDKRLSFLYELLPFLEQQGLYDVLREHRTKAWDDPAIQLMTDTSMNFLENPGIGRVSPGTTHYIGIAGVGKDAPELPLRHKRAGIFGYDRQTRIRDITDGTSNTAMMTETNETDIPWAGGGATIRALTQEPYINGPDGIGGPYPGGCHVLMADGSVQFLSENADPELLRRLAAMADGQPLGNF